MKKFVPLVFTILLIACSSEEVEPTPEIEKGVANVSVNLNKGFAFDDSFSSADSPWVHNFGAFQLNFNSKTNGNIQYEFSFDSYTSQINNLVLDFDNYTVEIPATYGSVKLSPDLFFYYPEDAGPFTISDVPLNLTLAVSTEFALITFPEEGISEITLDDLESTNVTVNMTIKDGYYYSYVRRNGRYGITVTTSENQEVSGVLDNPQSNVHYNYTLASGQGEASVTIALADTFQTEDVNLDAPLFFVDSVNNKTVKCPNANPGDTGSLNGKTYTGVNSISELRTIATDGNNLTCACTSNMTDLTELFYQGEVINSWEDISEWDVSNVVSFQGMFKEQTQIIGTGNTDMSYWDVERAEDMSSMFQGATNFNGPIGNWEFTSITNMSNMFFNAENMNQDLSNWFVQFVTECSGFSTGAIQWTLPQPNFTSCTF